MPEEMSNHFAFPDFATPVSGTLREVLDNDTTTREKSYLNGLVMKKVVSMMLKIGMEVAQYYTVFNFVLPSPQKYLNAQDITTVAGPGMKPAPKTFSQGTTKINFGRNPSQMR